MPQIRMFGRQLAGNLTEIPDPQMQKAQLPAGMSPAMLEGNLGLQMGLHEHRYANHKTKLAKDFAAISPGKVQQAARAHLTVEKGATCRLRPVGP